MAITPLIYGWQEGVPLKKMDFIFHNISHNKQLVKFIKQKTEIQDLVPLPSLRKFKIKVHFKMTEDS